MSAQRRSRHILKWLILVPLSFWLGPAPLFAQEQTISQMVHTTWTGRDGAPQGIFDLAQTPERAEKIRARFSCHSSVTGGTEVHLIVSARRAYQRQGRFHFFDRRTAA